VHHRFVALITRHRAIGGSYFALTSGDPGYLTDFRMKRYREPRRYFERNALPMIRESPSTLNGLLTADRSVARLRRLVGASSPRELFDPSRVVRATLQSQPDVATQAICFYVNSLGSWEDGAAVSDTVLRDLDQVPRDDSGGRLLAVSGYALCIAEADPRARRLWRLAHDRLAVAFDRFFLLLRAATAELKRYKDERRYLRAVDHAMAAAATLDKADHTAEDAAFAQSLVLNLRALASVTAGRSHEAAALVDRAWRTMIDIPLNRLTLPPGIAARYVVMVLENRGLLLVRQGRWAAAAWLFEELVSFARSAEPDSLSEALTLLGFAQLKQGSATAALAPLEEACELAGDDVRPGAHDAVRRLLAVACDEVGDPGRAAGWIQSLDTSPSPGASTLAEGEPSQASWPHR